MNDPQTDLTANVLRYLQTSSQSPLYGTQVALVQTLSGDQNALWWIRSNERDMVCKMFLDAGQARGRRQFNNQETAARLGIAPIPVTFERYPEGLSRQVMVYHWIPGTHLNALDAVHRDHLAEALVVVHTQDPAGHARLSPHPVNPQYQWNLIQGSQQRLEAWLDAQVPDDLTVALRHVLTAVQTQGQAVLAETDPAPPVLVHGDIYPEHCLVDPTGLRLVDWEMGGLGDPAREAAHVLIHVLRGVPATDRQHWRDQYLAHMQEPSLIARIRLYEILLPVASCLDLALHLLWAPEPTREDFVGTQTLLHLAFQECLLDVSRALTLDFEGDEVAHIAHIFHARLGQTVSTYAGA